MPPRCRGSLSRQARAHASGIFHATSVLGTWLAAIAGLMVSIALARRVPDRHSARALVFWVRSGIDEPQRWRAGRPVIPISRLGSFRELFGEATLVARAAILGLLLAASGWATFWGVTVAGQDLTREPAGSLGCRMQKAHAEARNSPTAS